MSEKLILRYTPRINDYTQGTCAMFWYILHWRFIVPCQVIIFLMGILLLVLFPELTFVAIVAISIPPFFGSYFLLVLLIVRRKLQKDEKFQSETTWEIGDDRVVIKNKFAESSLDWSLFKGARETKKLYLIRTSNFLYVPKRIFESSIQEAAFRNMIRNHIKKVQFKSD